MESLKELYKIGVGPSSSHTMGPKKASELFLKMNPNALKYEVTLYGSLALTGKGHLTDKSIRDAFFGNVRIYFDIKTKVNHPNTMDFVAIYSDHQEKKRFISVGGGSILLENEEFKILNIYKEKNFEEIKRLCKRKNQSLVEYVYSYEPDIKPYLELCLDKMMKAIDDGLNEEGELPGTLHVKRKAKYLYNQKDIIDTFDKRIVSAYAYAASETNASGGEIVTSPTCGASGVLPAVLRFAMEKYHLSKDKVIDSLAVAGVIGNVIKQNASISGAMCGCQAEVGSACAMASAALAYLMDLGIDEIEYCAEMALEHFLGLTCDPIKGYVQIPCIERNAVAAMRAFDNLALAYFITGSRMISFDVIIKTMMETGLDLQSMYKETSEGGLAKTYHDEF